MGEILKYIYRKIALWWYNRDIFKIYINVTAIIYNEDEDINASLNFQAKPFEKQLIECTQFTN